MWLSKLWLLQVVFILIKVKHCKAIPFLSQMTGSFQLQETNKQSKKTAKWNNHILYIQLKKKNAGYSKRTVQCPVPVITDSPRVFWQEIAKLSARLSCSHFTSLESNPQHRKRRGLRSNRFRSVICKGCRSGPVGRGGKSWALRLQGRCGDWLFLPLLDPCTPPGCTRLKPEPAL